LPRDHDSTPLPAISRSLTGRTRYIGN
jgi:hypothetical protein